MQLSNSNIKGEFINYYYNVSPDIATKAKQFEEEYKKYKALKSLLKKATKEEKELIYEQFSVDGETIRFRFCEGQ